MDLCGEEAVAPGKYMEPVYEGETLSKKEKDGANVYSFGDGCFSVNKDFMEANPGGAPIYMVFVATSERLELMGLNMEEVPFKDMTGSRGMKVKKKKKTEYITATYQFMLKQTEFDDD